MDMIDRLIAREGGAKVVNDPSDGGGLTKYGISQSSYPDLDIANITYEQAKDIYIRDFYVKGNIASLPEGLQENVLDFCVHSGLPTGTRYVQKIAGTQQDGQLGPVTAAAAAAIPVNDFLRAYIRERVLFLARQCIAMPNKLKYLVGWISRALSI